jgi:hypothetical protein
VPDAGEPLDLFCEPSHDVSEQELGERAREWYGGG